MFFFFLFKKISPYLQRSCWSIYKCNYMMYGICFKINKLWGGKTRTKKWQELIAISREAGWQVLMSSLYCSIFSMFKIFLTKHLQNRRTDEPNWQNTDICWSWVTVICGFSSFLHVWYFNKNFKIKRPLLFFFLFWSCPWHVEILGQGLNLHHSSDSAGSLTTRLPGNSKTTAFDFKPLGENFLLTTSFPWFC